MQAAASAATLVFSVDGMSCANCAEQAGRTLRTRLPGVIEANVDFDSRRARLVTARPVTRQQVRAALGTLGFEVRFADESGSAPLPEAVRSALDIRTISHGEAIRIEQHLVPGKVTIFDYYADWCGPCHLLTPKLERLLTRYRDVALRKVDVVGWDSPAAKQASRTFQIPGLPFTRIFDGRGNLVGEVHGNRIEEIEAIVARHARRKEAGR